MGKSEILDVFILGYFVVQGVLLWSIARSLLSPFKRALANIGSIGVVPAWMYFDGLSHQYADGGGLNNVLIFFALAGGIFLYLGLLFGRSLTKP